MPKPDSPRAFRIGIAGLAQTNSELLPGRLYALSAADPALALSCLAGTVALALRDKRQAVMITDAATEPLLQALQAFEIDVHAQVRSGRLRLFRWREQEYGIRLPDIDIQFVDELEHFKIPDGALIIVDPADSLLPHGDEVWLMTQIETYRSWLRGARAAMLCLLREPVGALSKLGESGTPGLGFSGFAQLRRTGDNPAWETSFWRFGKATVVSPPQQLSVNPQGWLYVDEDRRRPGERQRSMDSVADHGQVIYVAQGTSGERNLPPHWRMVEDLDAMLWLEPPPQAATCVIHAGGMQGFRKLAQTVHSLRWRHGRMLRIVVVERGVRLRSLQERLLLSIGANMVVFGATDLQRIENIVQALQGQWYQREIPENFSRAMAEALPPPQMGYLPPAEFAAGVMAGLVRARKVGLDSTLLRLAAAPGVAAGELIGNCQMSRAGDLITLDGDSVLLFLYACSARDVDAVLARTFAQPLSQLAGSEVRYDSNEAINQAVLPLHGPSGFGTAATSQSEPQQQPAPLHEAPAQRQVKAAPLPLRKGAGSGGDRGGSVS